MIRNYRFAGVEISVSMDAALFSDQEYHLGPFRTETVSEPYLHRFEIVDSLSGPEGELAATTSSMRVYLSPGGQIRYFGPCGDSWQGAYARVEHCGRNRRVQLKRSEYPGKVGYKTILECTSAEHLIAQNGGFVFHCSYIDRGGRAVLFTAPSETGKSTQAELWQKYRGAQIINGDRTAVRLADGVLRAEGIPFAGSSQFCVNRSLPIEAIVYLGQAPKTSIRRMRGYEAFSKIWEGVSVNTWDREDMELVSGVVQMIAERIPVYHMPCTPDESAVLALEEALRKQANA